MNDTRGDSCERRLPISIVVCTRNRADSLATALQTICEQEAAPADFEIIVVDNNSDDRTPEVAEEFRGRYPNVRYCQEPQVGLSRARNRGWQEARGRYVAYIDDDAKAPSSWVKTAKEVIGRHRPAAFGGPYYAFYTSPKPKWFKDAYGSYEQGDEPRTLGQWEFLSGSSIAIRRDLLERLGGFECRLGMTGTTMAYGEETELLKRLRAEMPGESIFYHPGLHVHHLVRAEKMTIRWMVRQHFVSGRSSYRVFGAGPGCRGGRWTLWTQALRTAGALSLDVVRSVLLRDRACYPYAQNYLRERALPHLERLGRICEQHRHQMHNPGLA